MRKINQKKRPDWNWRNVVNPAIKWAFLCCFAAGFFAHLFAFTNIIPNSDGVSRVSDAQQMTVSGRWFLHYATAWNGYVQAPAVIGFFSLLFLSLSAALTVHLLQVRSPLLGGLCGALMSVFPSVAYTFLYLFTASAYFFGMLLAVLAVFLTVRYRFGFLAGAVLLACAMGTYQAYLAVAASLSLMLVILFGLEGKHAAKEIVFFGLRLLGCLVLGLLLYFGILKLFLAVKKLELLDYKGINAMGSGFSLRGILSLLRLTYLRFFQYFFTNAFAKYTTPVAVVGNALLALTGIWAFVRLIRKNGCYQKPGAFVLTLCLCLLLPLAFNLTVMMGDGDTMPIMRYALVFVYVMVLVLADRAGDGENKKRKKDASAVLRLTAALAAGLLAVISFNIDNLAYTVSAQAHRSTLSFTTRLVDRVESTPGYQKGMEVVVIGGFPSSVYHNDIEVFTLVEDYSNYTTSVIPLNKHVYYYLNDWLNVTWAEPDEALMIAISDSEEFQEMPLYPDDGSIKIIDGRIVVKLASKYRPKKPYEIQYENRR